MKLYTLISISLIYSLVLSTGWAGVTYKWRDENGNIVYSQTPPKSGAYERLKTKNARPADASPASKIPSPGGSVLQKGQRERKEDQQVAAETAKNEELRKQNCKAAKKNLQNYTVYRRFKNEKGVVERMDDQERLRLLQESKDAIKEFCN